MGVYLVGIDQVCTSYLIPRILLKTKPLISSSRGYSIENNQERYTEKQRKVYAFMRVPYELEKFLFYGFLHCLDAFCYVFTFLPIRIIVRFFKLVRNC